MRTGPALSGASPVFFDVRVRPAAGDGGSNGLGDMSPGWSTPWHPCSVASVARAVARSAAGPGTRLPGGAVQGTGPPMTAPINRGA
ncbi:hypothetical protein CRV15_01110 [Streptomyces clavuligerus]|uniref:Uncharacterized protein n=1 Tax=Streptomyces clavuligerus TaxID=1901 RepID=B5GWU3_STRCL|nr:hypothetical protein D1794_01110 [Streptomyces clavuligerus]EDY50789.1 hypothetical protein SSCG_03469 [Streptomyces clavuligerus]EFG10567.1 Hypothetical protein SCLAV_5500 [Streptomyces clavuligerus]QCS04311.1 hypothetical protein CRV15_01110 [Streptomyces clavuligerus]QPJ96301.1 hypothetical protein GE265_26760 [Streptomyces clavuligerus]